MNQPKPRNLRTQRRECTPKDNSDLDYEECQDWCNDGKWWAGQNYCPYW